MPNKTTTEHFYGLSKKITNVYFSNIKFKLKNDCVCRLIAEVFDTVSSVSILLYQSNVDCLINFGHYFDPFRAKAKFLENALLDQSLLRNISLYEYFAAKFESQSFNEGSWSDFKSSSYFSSNFYYGDKRQNLTKVIFQNIQDNFLSTGKAEEVLSEYEKYRRYKTTVAVKDFYFLRNPDTLSGKYFHDLVAGGLDISEKKHKFSGPYETSNNHKVLYNIYESDLGIQIGNEYIYFAIPLLANGRYIGLIRFIWHSEELLNKANWLSQENRQLIEKKMNAYGEKELYELSDMIALHIGNEYPVYEFKKLAKTPLPDYNQYADLFSNALNCKSCIIRAGKDEDSKPEIVGYTYNINEYVLEIKNSNKDPFKKQEGPLLELFRPAINFKDQSEIIAIQFDIIDTKIDNIIYLYFSSNEIVRSTKNYSIFKEATEPSVSEIFESQLLKNLENIQIAQVLIVKIPNTKNGYITFFNTIFRPFIPNDLDVIYPQISRIGSELFIRQSLLLEKRATFLSSIYHELLTPATLAYQKAISMNETIDDLIENDFPPIKVKKILTNLKIAKISLPKQFEYLLKFIEARLAVYSATNDFDRNSAFSPNLPYSLEETIASYISMFKEYANKFYLIDIICDWKTEDCNQEISHNDVIFLGIFMYLMRNALKYSFTRDQRIEKVPGYDQNFERKSDGHIKVKCFSDNKSYGYSITNWGKRIPENWTEKVFDLHQRGPVDPNFEPREAPVKGEGLGLYYVKQFADKLGATVTITPKNEKTQITLAWNI